jgi:DNA topoisomerase-3
MTKKLNLKYYMENSYDINKNNNVFYTLSSIQIDALNNFNYTCLKTLKILDTLFEKNVITNPRTYSEHKYDDSFPISKILFNDILIHCELNIELKYFNINKKPKSFNTNKVFEKEGLSLTDLNHNIKLSTEENNIYELILMRFLCQFLPSKDKLKIKRIIDNF